MSNSTTYPLARQGVFHTIQGEGQLIGLPTVFVRFAGCPVGCPECDTDYSLASKVELSELLRAVVAEAKSATEWVWLTGGEPTIHNLQPVLEGLHKLGFKVALATAGIREVRRGRDYAIVKGVTQVTEGFDFISVSPHATGPELVQWRGSQVNLVFGLNGFSVEKAEPFRRRWEEGFDHCVVTAAEGDEKALQSAMQWVEKYRGWRLGIQAHKHWGLA